MMDKSNNKSAEELKSYLAKQPKIYVSDFDRKCYKKELCKALEDADEIIANLYAQMHDDPTWVQAAKIVEDLILRLDDETE